MIHMNKPFFKLNTKNYDFVPESLKLMYIVWILVRDGIFSCLTTFQITMSIVICNAFRALHFFHLSYHDLESDMPRKPNKKGLLPILVNFLGETVLSS